MPKFRFALDFGGYIWWVKTIQFPKLSQEKSEASEGFGGNVVYKSGPSKWQPITATMADIMIFRSDFPDGGFIDSNRFNMSTQAFWFGIANVLDDHQQEDGFLISKAKGRYNEGIKESWLDSNLTADRTKIASMKIQKFYDIDGLGNSIESWILENVIISEIDFGGGDYASDEINEISVTFTYDAARIEDESTGAESLFDPNEEAAKTKKEAIRNRVKENKEVRRQKSIQTIID